MSPETIDKLLDIGGNAAVLWVACVFLIRTLKNQYDDRIAALEAAVETCEKDRAALHARFEAFLIRKIDNSKI